MKMDSLVNMEMMIIRYKNRNWSFQVKVFRLFQMHHFISLIFIEFDVKINKIRLEYSDWLNTMDNLGTVLIDWFQIIE